MTSKTVETVNELNALWRLLFSGVHPPDDAQWALWLLRHDAAVVRRGLTELATKYRRLNGKMDELYMAKFASAVMNRLSRDQPHERKPHMNDTLTATEPRTPEQIVEAHLASLPDHTRDLAQEMLRTGEIHDGSTFVDARAALDRHYA